LKSLSVAYADVLKDSALVEASRQLRAESDGDGRYAALHRQRAEVLAESASWLCEAAWQVSDRARQEAPSRTKGN
ncbi:MAG: hypothetical protein HC861_10950, partial [Rhodospirillaceae bacterium]|nr:hypothetical protein [Rhodospirillaceae bacterium]